MIRLTDRVSQPRFLGAKITSNPTQGMMLQGVLSCLAVCTHTLSLVPLARTTTGHSRYCFSKTFTNIYHINFHCFYLSPIVIKFCQFSIKRILDWTTPMPTLDAGDKLYTIINALDSDR